MNAVSGSSFTLIQSSNYFDYLDVYPELQVLVDHFEMIREEALSVSRQPWTPWPEDHYNDCSKTPLDWTVFPFMHTFPALDASKSQWIATTSSLCPRTVSILKQIIEHRLPKDYDYHRIPAPWVQMNLLKIGTSITCM